MKLPTRLIRLALTIIFFAAGCSLQPYPTVVIAKPYAAEPTPEVERTRVRVSENTFDQFEGTSHIKKGPASIWKSLVNMHRAGRKYEFSSVRLRSNAVVLTVDISDRGHVWAQQSITARISNTIIPSFEIVPCRLTLWRISDEVE